MPRERRPTAVSRRSWWQLDVSQRPTWCRQRARSADEHSQACGFGASTAGQHARRHLRDATRRRHEGSRARIRFLYPCLLSSAPTRFSPTRQTSGRRCLAWRAGRAQPLDHPRDSGFSGAPQRTLYTRAALWAVRQGRRSAGQAVLAPAGFGAREAAACARRWPGARRQLGRPRSRFGRPGSWAAPFARRAQGPVITLRGAARYELLKGRLQLTPNSVLRSVRGSLLASRGSAQPRWRCWAQLSRVSVGRHIDSSYRCEPCRPRQEAPSRRWAD
jgi:hypothetical protein